LEKKIGVKLALHSPDEYIMEEVAKSGQANMDGTMNSTSDKYQFSAEMSVQQAQDSIISAAKNE
jgi:hypothetical protein